MTVSAIVSHHALIGRGQQAGARRPLPLDGCPVLLGEPFEVTAPKVL
jgi:hypothetical protein